MLGGLLVCLVTRIVLVAIALRSALTMSCAPIVRTPVVARLEIPSVARLAIMAVVVKRIAAIVRLHD